MAVIEGEENISVVKRRCTVSAHINTESENPLEYYIEIRRRHEERNKDGTLRSFVDMPELVRRTVDQVKDEIIEVEIADGSTVKVPALLIMTATSAYFDRWHDEDLTARQQASEQAKLDAETNSNPKGAST
jgi:hypothetical protein